MQWFPDGRAWDCLVGHAPFFAALAVLNRERINEMQKQLLWSVDNGLLMPTTKLRRSRTLKCYAEEIGQLYAGHQ